MVNGPELARGRQVGDPWRNLSMDDDVPVFYTIGVRTGMVLHKYLKKYVFMCYPCTQLNTEIQKYSVSDAYNEK